MRLLGNIIWLIFGGLGAAVGYFTASLSLAVTIVGLPWAWQTFKIGLLCLWPFGSKVVRCSVPSGCLYLPLNLLWLIFGGLYSFVCHIVFGLLLCLSIVGIPFGRQHFKMAGLSLMPFGKDVKLEI